MQFLETARSRIRRKKRKKFQVIPLVVYSLGAIPKQFEKRLQDISIWAETGQLQRVVLLDATTILKNVLEI